MDVSDIKLIQTLILSGSLSEASLRLNQSQPTLSRKLARLEDELSTALFYRSPKGLQPTEIAQYIVSASEPLENQLRTIGRYVELATQLKTGKINVGVGPIIEQVLLPDVLQRFIDLTGDVRISVMTEDERTLLAMLEASRLDVVIGPFETDDYSKKSLIAMPMVSDDIIAVAARTHPIFAHKKVNEKIFAKYALATPKTQGSVTQSSKGPRLPDPKLTFDNYSLLKMLTINSELICAGPKALFKEELDKNTLRKINLDLNIFWESTLLVRPETLSTPLVSKFVDLCETTAKGLRTRKR